MRKTFSPKAWLTPNPVLIIASYDKDGNVAIMNAAWGGIVDTDLIGITISKGHNTTKAILENKYFTISLATKQTVVAADYVGLVSGNNEKNKFEKSGLSSTKSANINAPIINEMPLCFECKMESYDEDSAYLLARVESMSIDEDILNEKGKVDLNKFHPIIFNPLNNAYHEIGSFVDNAFSCGFKLK